MVDSSVAINWFVPEPLVAEADQLLRSEEELVAPTLILAEVANVMWRKVRLSEATEKQAVAAIGELETLVALRPLDADLIRSAFEIARAVKHSIYDCIFFACAIAEDARFVTADTKFAAKVSGHGERSRLWLMRPKSEE